MTHARPQQIAAAPPPPSASPAAASPIIAVSRRDDAIAIGPVLPDDIGALFVWLNDVEAAKTDFPYIPLDGVAFKAWMDRAAEAKNEFLFAIRSVAESRLIGFAMLKNLHPVHRSAELGVRIGPDGDRGRGYGARAAKLMARFAFDTLNLNRVHLTTAADNRRAIASYLRAGFREEGVMRQANFLDGKWRDVVVMSRLRADDAGAA